MPNKLLKLPQLILIAGEQQNVGKTMLACQIISHFSRENHISAIKVTPHFHKDTGSATSVIKKNNYQILEETHADNNKDTSRMLKAGTKKAYLLQANPEAIKEGLEEVLEKIPEDHLIVCESAGVREHVQPGIFLAIRQLYCKICSIEDENMFSLADRIVTYTVNSFDLMMNEISIENGKWKLNTNQE